MKKVKCAVGNNPCHTSLLLVSHYKVFKYDGRNGLVTGNYPNPSYTFQNYDVTPIIRWAYINDIVK